MTNKSRAEGVKNQAPVKQTEGKRSREDDPEQLDAQPLKKQRQQSRAEGAEKQASMPKGEKRPREESVELIDVQPSRKRRQLIGNGAASVPLNDPDSYNEARANEEIITVQPSDKTELQAVREQDLLDIVVLGGPFHDVIERLVVDDETGLPLQVCKVTVEFKRIDYKSSKQFYAQSGVMDEPPVSPTTLPYVNLKKSIQRRRGF